MTNEQLRLAGVIADKIEDGTLFQAGIYSRRELAEVIRAVAAKVEQFTWKPIKTAPRTGETIHVRFGSDGIYQAKFLPGSAYPWVFIEQDGDGQWFLNRAVDGLGGPSHWMAIR